MESPRWYLGENWPEYFLRAKADGDEITVATIRWLNRETLCPWPLAFLSAIIQSGWNLEERADEPVRTIMVETDSLIALAVVVGRDRELMFFPTDIGPLEFTPVKLTQSATTSAGTYR